ncbi:type VI secretion system baseplate subunit TssG [Ancylobacter amanitiformis]|uniref:Type VI secretion system protein ImpH n=1 Tax=Ancylobacter amanitiformis TaxID=217069 RepID=A0ABU0LL98_9HYPH|nr:type VI secretion system baseplate subunit TssG [Ancylobacter amanitiformis]MDQ0509448.1 type VI secretion system protein ImpH [Ancylobacter amanitiformis]
MAAAARHGAAAVTRPETMPGATIDQMALDALEPQRAAFFALALHFERLFPDAPPLGATGDPTCERVRFGAHPSLGYPPGEVEALTWNPEAGHALMQVNFLGLYGPSSPLPATYTERVIGSDGAAGALGLFLDLFNHRLTGLLVRIWKQQRHHLRYSAGGGDAISQAVAALIGLLPSGGSLHRPSLLPFAGLLSCYSLSASIIASVISHCTGLPVRIDEFIPRTVTLPPDKRSRLGDAPPELGGDFIAGSEVVDHTGMFRVVIGPLDQTAFRTVLPDQPAFAAVVELVQLSLRDPLAFDIRLELEPGALPAFVLGDARLGWDSWAAPAPAQAGHADFAGDKRMATI